MSIAEKLKSSVNWFEIPTVDIERARRFYEAILHVEMKGWPEGDEPMYIFAATENGVTGALVQREFQKPAGAGTLVYLNCDGKLDAVVERVEKSGGKMLMPKTQITGGFGHFALIEDCEGNHAGLHAAY